MPLLPGTLVRDLLSRQAEPRACHGIIHHAPADLSLLRLGRSGEQGALLRIEHVGFLELPITLVRLDGSNGLVVELAIDQAVVLAHPSEIGLDDDAVGERNGRKGIPGRRRRALSQVLGGEQGPPGGGAVTKHRAPRRRLAESVHLIGGPAGGARLGAALSF